MVKQTRGDVADAEKLSDSDESQDEEGLMKDDLEDAEELVFDFEAYPICDGDKEGLVNMLTQVFLRVDIDVKQMADILVEQSPFGCVYRPAEEFMDEDDEGVVYGVLSMLKLGTDQKFQTDIWTLLKARAQKYSIDKKILSILDNLSTPTSDIRVGLLINERLLHFPATIASPAFKSLANDLEKFGAQYRFSHVVLILKIRIADNDGNKERNGASASDIPKNRKKLTKAQKKRIAANAIANAKVIYDNREEELLFQDGLQFDYFQYPVQSDVEKDSKFSSVVREGVTYRPYRRVCFLDSSTFHRYIELQISIEQFHKLSLITPTEDKQISNKKEKPIIDAAITANKLRSGYSTSGNFEWKSLDDLNIFTNQKSNEKYILEQSNSQQMTYPHSAITDSGQFQFDDNGIDKETNTTKRLLFKSTIITESSSPSTISSAYSVTDEMSEINEEKMSNYDLNGFEEITSTENYSSSSSTSSNSSRKLTQNNSTARKSMDFEMENYKSNNSSSSSSSSNSSSTNRLSVKQTKQFVSNEENEFESISDSETLYSTTRTTESYKSGSYETKKHERKEKLNYSEENRKHRKDDNICSMKCNKLNSGNILKYESISNSSANSRSSRELAILDKRSYKIKRKPSIADTNNFANMKYNLDDLENLEQSDVSWHSKLKYTNLLANFDNCSRKTEFDGKKSVKNVAVQTINLESNNDILPMFTPLLLKDIERNMKGMSKRKAISTVIQTHVELIKRQAQREKRLLEEWNSAISDLEERCQLVSFERLKLLLHSNNYSYT
uniref:Uncharacterized protein n=1 Tax=Wuchereria bancrofti TaxID=6293 RepID=A0AAF5PVH1_WUCBA